MSNANGKGHAAGLPDIDLTAEAILEVADIRIERVAVPEWGGHVHIKALTAAEAERFSMGLIGKGGKASPKTLEGFSVRLVALGLCNAEGERLFTLNQTKKLSEKNGGVITRLSKRIAELSGMRTEAAEGEEADLFGVEAAKNG